MKKSRFTDSEIIEVLKRVEAGLAVPDTCLECLLLTLTRPMSSALEWLQVGRNGHRHLYSGGIALVGAASRSKPPNGRIRHLSYGAVLRDCALRLWRFSRRNGLWIATSPRSSR